MTWRKAISALDFAAFGICVPVGIAATIAYAYGNVPWAAMASGIWTILMAANWLEFRRWKSGNHRLLRESARDRDEFSRQVFMARGLA